MANRAPNSNTPCTVDEAIRRVQAYAVSQGWTKSRLAREAGLQDTTLRKFDKPDWNPTADTLRALAKVVPHNFRFNGGGGK